MRKIFTLVISICIMLSLISNSIADEILFRNLPWGSDPNAMEKELKAAGFLYPIASESSLVYLDRYLDELDRSYLDNSRITEEYCGWGLIAFNFSEDGPSVAGYSISSVQAYFHSPIKDGTVNLEKKAAGLYLAQYTLNVIDFDTAFDELSSKLTKLYGEPIRRDGKTSALINENDVFFTTCDTIRLYYYGDNNSVVVMEKAVNEGKGIALVIIYGQMGFDEHIAKCDKTIKQEKYQERLNKEQDTDRSENFSGL